MTKKIDSADWLDQTEKNDEAFYGDGSRRSKSRLPRIRRVLYALVVFAIVVTIWFAINPSYSSARDTIIDGLLRAVGFGWAPLLFWGLVFCDAFRRSPRQALQHWNRWLGLLLLAGAVSGALFFSDVRLSMFGRYREFNLGGLVVGGSIAGFSSAIGFARVLALAIAGSILIAPHLSLRIARGSFIGTIGFLRLSRKAYSAFPLHRVFAWAFIVIKGSRNSSGTHLASEQIDLSLVERIGKVGGPEVKPRESCAGPKRDAATSVNSSELTHPDISDAIVEDPRLPSVKLLRRVREKPVSEAVTTALARRIEVALAQYGIQVAVEQVRSGPTVTLFGLVPGWVRRQRNGKEQETERRVTVDAILAREKDLALALAAPSLRFEAPMPGESMVGVEVPNPEPNLLTLGSLMDSDEFSQVRSSNNIPIALGKGSGGDLVVADLASMPHLLVAGTTGSGKSVCINALLSCLLMEFSPWQMRLLLVDPKRVELTQYNGIPHLVSPVVVEADQAVKALRGSVIEMTHRLRLLEEQGSRNIQDYNRQVKSPLDRMPYFVVVVDELADLMMVAPNDIEHALCRLAQLGRATGIHLVVATQRPSVDVVTGLIKANFPSRISFAVASHTDSKTILDATGADKLLGRGDMLFLPQEMAKPKRAQGAFISDEEMRQLVEFWKTNEDPLPPPLLLESNADQGESKEVWASAGRDDLLDKAMELAQRHSRVSTSLLQRRLRIGYPRAARLRDELEDSGVISPEGDVL